jgi:ATP-dependent Lhr-like helicase
VPDDRLIVVEQFRDETDAVRVVIHAPFGGRVHAPWGMALANRVRDWLATGDGRWPMGGRSEPPTADRPSSIAAFEIQVQTTDDGIMLRMPSLRDWLPVSVLRDMTPDDAERRVLDEIGSSSLFGARFRMNAARALLLPRGNPRRRMPLWLQRLKALDLLQAVREFPSFPILVETYRDVLQDAFDMQALARVLRDIGTGAIDVRSVETAAPSPMAASLQFGFVMDWMYADDAPRAEQRAALLSLDRALLDELMGAEGADEATLAMLEVILARRRGTAPGTRARTADELAALLDRAGDLTLEDIGERVATLDEGRRGDPIAELLGRSRAIAIDIPTSSADAPLARRVILTETFARYASAFGDATMTTVYSGAGLEPMPAEAIVPPALRQAAMTRAAARREILARFVSLAGAVSLDDITQRYAIDPDWTTQRLDEWTRSGKLVRGRFGGSEHAVRWCSRRLLEQARRRELAQARRQIEAVDLPVFARFLQRWQHVEPATRLDDDEGLSRIVNQLAGLARPADRWERDYLPLRVERYRADVLSRSMAMGELVWVGQSSSPDEPPNLASIRFVHRGSARAWLPAIAEPPLSDAARRTRESLERDGASFFDELAASTSLTPRKLRDALRELAGAGLVTNDTMDSMRAVVRWQPIVSPRDRAQPDPTRWLPADFTPSENRYVVQRRPNIRRLPKWKRPDKEDASADRWPGRWSLVRTDRVLGPHADECARASVVARQWLVRAAIVSREMWRRERPSISWRAIYLELKRLEFRGDVRRGYFVRGLSGAQFALPDAIEMLRERRDGDAEPVVLLASDPANAYSLPLAESGARDPFVRPRSRGSVLVSIDGRVVMMAERRGARVAVRPDTSDADLTRAATALATYLLARTTRDVTIETINGQSAAASAHAERFRAAGFRPGMSGLRYYRSLGS